MFRSLLRRVELCVTRFLADLSLGEMNSSSLLIHVEDAFSAQPTVIELAWMIIAATD